METTPSPQAGSDAASDGSLPVRIGTYRVLRRLATGGTSDVLLAKSEGPQATGQTVVLKLLLQEYRDDPQFEKMFTSEAAAYSRLSHPAIVRLYDFFTDGEQLVMVLEYVDGMALHRLRALLKRGKFLDDSAAMFVAWRVFGALAAAHTARDPSTGALSPVIHRDVNPSNVLIPWDGQVKIADFGIAKVAGIDNDKTAAGFIKGTYGYMAPEQVRGENVTDKADVYAASLLLWELLVGRKAIVRGGTSDLDVLRAMAEPAFPALSALRPELPLEVLDAVDRGLERDPAKRTITADELAGVLRISCNLEDGRQRLVDALGGVRPLPRPDELAVTISRPPRPSVDASADATIPNLSALADDSQSLPPLPSLQPLSTTPPPPVVAAAAPRPAPPPPRTTPPRPAPTPPAPPPVPAATVRSSPLRSAPTLMGISPARSPAPSTAGPTIVEKSPTPLPTVVITPTPRPGPQITRPPSVPPPPPPPPPPPVTVRTPPPPPPVASAPAVHVPPVHVPTVAAGFVVSPFASTGPIAATPAPFPPTATKQPSTRPPPPPPPPPPPAQAFAPAPQPPIAWTPTPPPPVELRQHLRSDAPPAPPQTARIIAAAAAVVALLVTIVVIAWERGRSPSAYVPPDPAAAALKASAGPTPSAVASAAVTPPPVATPPAASAPPVAVAPPSAPASTGAAAPAATMGTITVPHSQSGHRVWVDKHIVGESPGTFTVRCGWRSVQVGSQGYRHNVNIPCGGDVVVH